MRSLDDLLSAIKAEALKGDMSLDVEVYAQAKRPPTTPILFAGSLDSRIAFLARDLGRDEVLRGEPLIGGAGRRVRRALYRKLRQAEPPSGDPYLREAVNQALLTNI